MKSALLALFPCLLAATVLAAADPRTAADEAAVRRTALDYIEGWYTRDAARMERALHPDLVKRIVRNDNPAASVLNDGGKEQLVRATTPAPGQPRAPLGNQRRDIVILDLYGNAATVKVDAQDWVDYLHLVRWNGEWKILNVLWELRPRPGG